MRCARTVAGLVCFTLVLLVAERGYCGDEKPKQSGDVKAAAKIAAPAGQQAKAPAKRKKARGRLPFYYGKVGLSPEQRETIYGLQATYRPQLAELEKQLKELKAKLDAEVEAVLTDAQKQKLLELQEAARKKRDSRTKPQPAKTTKESQ